MQAVEGGTEELAVIHRKKPGAEPGTGNLRLEVFLEGFKD
jgi:hypothetical protein